MFAPPGKTVVKERGTTWPPLSFSSYLSGTSMVTTIRIVVSETTTTTRKRTRTMKVAFAMRKCSVVFAVVIVLFRPATTSYSIPIPHSNLASRDVHTRSTWNSKALTWIDTRWPALVAFHKGKLARSCGPVRGVYPKQTVNCSPHYVHRYNKVSCGHCRRNG